MAATAPSSPREAPLPPLIPRELKQARWMLRERDVTDILAMLTAHPARILRLPDYGLHVGARADLVLWETERPAEVVTTMAPRRLVVKAGRLSVEHERRCRDLWRAGV